MNLHLHRDVLTPDFTLGVLRVDLKLFGFVCEDTDRLHRGEAKVSGRTAIPAGTYRVLRTWSPKYGRDMLAVIDVPGFRGIRIHSGNDSTHTEGCLLPGLGRDITRGLVLRSRSAAQWLEANIPVTGCSLVIGYDAPEGGEVAP